MDAIITSKSKFFAEALKLSLGDVVEKIRVVHDPEKLKELLKISPPEYIFCDFECVKENPEEFNKIMKDRGKAKLIVFSFDPMNTNRKKLAGLDIDLYINRPLDPFQVKEAILSLKK